MFTIWLTFMAPNQTNAFWELEGIYTRIVPRQNGTAWGLKGLGILRMETI